MSVIIITKLKFIFEPLLFKCKISNDNIICMAFPYSISITNAHRLTNVITSMREVTIDFAVVIVTSVNVLIVVLVVVVVVILCSPADFFLSQQ